VDTGREYGFVCSLGIGHARVHDAVESLSTNFTKLSRFVFNIF
jgi:hypothetical protein